MGLVLPLFGFGIGLVAFGFFYHLFSDVINLMLAVYILNNEYYVFSDFVWDMLPWIVVFGGVVCLILAGVSYRGTRTVVSE